LDGCYELLAFGCWGLSCALNPLFTSFPVLREQKINGHKV